MNWLNKLTLNIIVDMLVDWALIGSGVYLLAQDIGWTAAIGMAMLLLGMQNSRSIQ